MSPAGQAVVTCWNCEQVVQATATSCLWCGVAVQPTVTPIVVAPDGATPPAPAAPVVATDVDTHHVPPVEAAPVPYSPPPRAPKRQAVPLSGAFNGTSSSVGAQVGAFTIDVLSIAAITATVHVVVASGLITAITLIEALVFMWVLEARTGLTLGHLLLRMRSSRAGTPFSPGAGRAFVRQAVLNASLLVAVVGGWLVASSGAWDSSGQQRSLAAKASGTRAVKQLPKPRAAHTAEPHVSGPQAGTIPAVSPGGGLAAPRVVSTSTRGAPTIDNSHSVSTSEPRPPQHDHAAPQLVTNLDPAAPASPDHRADSAADHPQQIAPVPGAAAPEPAPEQAQPHAEPLATTSPAPTPGAPATATPAAHQPTQGGALLLVFDTGQRATLAMGTAINLGRKPSPVEPTDQLIAVEDPEGTVSKFHARLEHSRGYTWITDQGSTNGTDLLDEDGATRLEPGVRTLIAEGARARIGNRSFTVSVLLDPTPSPEIPT